MSTATGALLNGTDNNHHEHILRPRAVKPGNPGVLRALSEDGLLAPNGTKEYTDNGSSTGQTRYLFVSSKFISWYDTDLSSGRSTPVPADAPPSSHSIASARKELRAEQRRRIFHTIDYKSRVSHLDPTSEYANFQGFYVLFWIALTILAVTTMLRNIKDTGYPMRVKIWGLFTVKFWEMGVADGLMVASTGLSLPLHKMFRNNTLGFGWLGGGMAIQSIYQAVWFSCWVALVRSSHFQFFANTSQAYLLLAIGRGRPRYSLLSTHLCYL